MKEKGETFKCIFAAGEDWHNNACLGCNDPESIRSMGYKEAADHLVINAEDLGMQDLFVYPICFLYRHHLELQLKLIILRGNILLRKPNDCPMIHKLPELWENAKEIILKIFNGNIDALRLISHVLDELNRIDPNGEAFRYHTDKNGSNYLSAINRINLRHLSEYVNESSDILDGIEMELSELIELSAEYAGYL